MEAKQIWKLVLVVAVLAVAALSLYPLDKRLKPGLDLAGGTVFVYQVDIKPGDDAKTIVESVIEVLRKRVDPSGVRNLIWRPLAGNRIEIQAPLAPKETVQLRKTFTKARESLQNENLRPARIDSSMRQSDAAQRQTELNAIAAENAELRQRLEAMAAAFDELRLATDAFDGADAELKAADAELAALPADATDEQKAEVQARVGQLAAGLEPLADAERQVESRFSEARSAVFSWNVDPHELQTVLAPIDDWAGLKPLQRTKAKETFNGELTDLIALHPDREAPIRAVTDAHFEYVQVKGPLDDPNDLKALLRGAGVLEFRIGPSPDEVPDLADYRDRLHKQGPAAGANQPYRWFVIDDITQFADTEAERQALQASPETYFANPQQLNMIGQGHRDQYYVLLGNTEYDSITESQSGWKLTNARYSIDRKGFPAVSFILNATGGRLMTQLTAPDERRFKPLAIVLDNRLITAPSINDKLATHIEVSRGGGFSPRDQQYLVNTLNAGTLKARLSTDPISENTTGPQLGQDNLDRGFRAAYWGLIVVAAFMALYYLFGGLVADFALMSNMVLILGTMATLQATFTLPGIAGIVLTIGMAVDANVLIFERIREELQRKADVRTAVRLGYQKALVTILDANITTLITCLILGYTATAEVKGFAVTLGIGIVATLFTALFCTRVIVELSIEIGRMRSLPMLPMLVPAIGTLLRPNLNWIGRRHAFFAVSGLLIAAGVATIAWRGEDMLDIEFRAGTKVAFQLKNGADGKPMTLTLDEVRKRLDLAGANPDFPIPELTRKVGPSVVTLGNADASGNTVKASAFSVATLSLDQHAVSTAIKLQFADVLEQEAPLTFHGAATGTDAPDIREVGRHLVFPIKEAVLGRNPALDRPDVQNDVSDYLGGVAIILEGITPPETLQSLRNRISSMRQGPQFEDVATWREYDLIGVEFADVQDDGQATFRSAVVVIAPDELTNYVQDDSKFYADPNGLAATEWKIVHSALRRDRSLDSVSSVSPQVSTTMKNRAVVAMALSLLAVVAYIWLRFGSLRYGLAAIAALVHDVVIALGLVAICGRLQDTAIGHALMFSDFKVNLALVAALLTIVGYSLNDTIVIFDRIRENRGRLATATPAIINESINQTISRTVLTSGTTLLAVLTLYIFGGEGVHGFAFAMLIGVFVGTYSSIAIAAPLLILGRGAEQQPPGGQTAN